MRARTLAVQGLIGLPVAAALLSGARPAEAAGPWVWPLAGPHTVSRGFDPPATPYGPGHRGADLPGRPGQPVRAAGAGRISYAGLLAGRGVVVVVHGDLRTTYEPVVAAVRVGQQVAAGESIGQLATGGHPGCPQVCLHWGLLRGAVYLDPVQLVARRPSRLLPVGAPQVAVGPAAVAPAAVVPAGALPPRLAVSPAAVPRPADEPAFSLRAGDAASAGGALAALVAGLVLLRRPPRPPHHPVTPAVAAAGPAPDPAPIRHESQAVGLVDLAAERHRRRPEVA